MGVNVIRIRPEDNVGVATEPIAPGTAVRIAEALDLTAKDEIPYGNKIALVAIAEGDPIVKYGEHIGHASTDITPGECVHTHNVTRLEVPDVYVEIT